MSGCVALARVVVCIYCLSQIVIDPQCPVPFLTEQGLINGLSFPQNQRTRQAVTYRHSTFHGVFDRIFVKANSQSKPCAIFGTYLPVVSLLFPAGHVHGIVHDLTYFK